MFVENYCLFSSEGFFLEQPWLPLELSNLLDTERRKATILHIYNDSFVVNATVISLKFEDNAILSGTEVNLLDAFDQKASKRKKYHLTSLICDVRICNMHLDSGRPILAKTEYLQRHNKAVAYLHWTIYRAFSLDVMKF